MSQLGNAVARLMPEVQRRVLAELALFLVRCLGPIQAEVESLARAIPKGHAGAWEAGSVAQLIEAAELELAKCARKLNGVAIGEAPAQIDSSAPG